MEQKNWAVVRTVVGFHRYDTEAELKVRDGPKITKRYDLPTTPHHRAERHTAVSTENKTIMNDTLVELNPAAIQRRIQALTAELLTLTRSEHAPTRKPQIPALTPRASAHESTTPATRAS